MTHHDKAAGADTIACAFEPTGLWVRAVVNRPHRHRDGWVFDLRPLDPNRPGRLTTHLSAEFMHELEQASGILLHPEDLAGDHTLLLTLNVEPLLGLTGRILGMDRGLGLKAWAKRDAEVRRSLEADGLWGRQRSLPAPQKLRRVCLIEPDDGAPHPIGETLARWYDLGLIELIRFPVAYEEPGSVVALHKVFGDAYDQYDWGTLDAVIVEPSMGFAHRALSDETLMRRVAVLPVPVLFRRAGTPTLLDGIVFCTCETAEVLLDVLSEVLRSELRTGGYARLEAIVRELVLTVAPSEAPSSHVAPQQGPLFE